MTTMTRAPRLTSRDLGRAFAIAGIPDHIYTLVWGASTEGEWCGVKPITFRQDIEPFTVRKDSLRRLYVRNPACDCGSDICARCSGFEH